MLGFREVTKSEFFKEIGGVDCYPTVRGKYEDDDYGSDFTTPGRKIIGKTIMSGPNPQYKPYATYYLKKCEDNKP